MLINYYGDNNYDKKAGYMMLTMLTLTSHDADLLYELNMILCSLHCTRSVS